MRRLAALLIILLATLGLVRPIGPERGPGGPNPVGTPSAFTPDGPSGTWDLLFNDEFDRTSVDTTKWNYTSSAEADDGQGNLQNQQLSWNQGQNCTEASGLLTITAQRQTVTSPSGQVYDWTSCLLSSTFSFQYGYIETRAELPSPAGFWPGFWTWQVGNSYIETDAFEFYSDNHSLLYLTQHSGAGGGCEGLAAGFDPTTAFHVYGVDIEPSGTTWYIDGHKVFTAAGTSTGATNILLDDFVYSVIPPASTTNSATEQIDYVRAYAKVG